MYIHALDAQCQGLIAKKEGNFAWKHEGQNCCEIKAANLQGRHRGDKTCGSNGDAEGPAAPQDWELPAGSRFSHSRQNRPPSRNDHDFPGMCP